MYPVFLSSCKLKDIGGFPVWGVIGKIAINFHSGIL